MSTLRRAAVLVLALGVGLGLSGCLDHSAEHRLRANAFLRGNDAASALKECDDGLSDKKDDLPLLILRGKALFELDRLDDAGAAYADAVRAGAKLDVRSLAEAHLGLAMVATRKHAWADARREFEILVSTNDRDATSHLNVAKACLELKDMKCAIDHGEAAVHLRDRDEGILFSLGTIYLAADKVDEAQKTFERICEVVPGVATCPYGLALVAAKRGDKEKALTQLEDAVKKKIPNPERLATDPGFASMAGEARFKALAQKAAAAAK